MILSQKLGKFIWLGDIYLTVRDIYLRWRVIYLTGRDIYLTGRDIYFKKAHNFVTNYEGDEILIMCTNPNVVHDWPFHSYGALKLIARLSWTTYIKLADLLIF